MFTTSTALLLSLLVLEAAPCRHFSYSLFLQPVHPAITSISTDPGPKPVLRLDHLLSGPLLYTVTVSWSPVTNARNGEEVAYGPPSLFRLQWWEEGRISPKGSLLTNSTTATLSLRPLTSYRVSLGGGEGITIHTTPTTTPMEGESTTASSSLSLLVVGLVGVLGVILGLLVGALYRSWGEARGARGRKRMKHEKPMVREGILVSCP